MAELGATPTPLCAKNTFGRKYLAHWGVPPTLYGKKIVSDTLPFMQKIPPQVSEGSQPTPVPTISEQSDHLSPVSPLLEVGLTVVQVEN